ncbi:hypothetical protein SAMN04488102_10555 [Alkalibacterium subtropicum]|uniref:Uncharacterized protein n=1 Tax=Alkalibacterium subtropicum TaxID=753702 RepID=A0A1I1IE69_9LACT|nr:hypothetical protein [Alkalibacterium subtropicum]SFC33982.1 hypothetical protein SAMN04488102_10555 [Alkalibacterium subtropicum]
MKKIMVLSTSVLMFNISTIEKEYNIPRDQFTEEKKEGENEMIFPTGVFFPGGIEDEELP